MKVKNLKIFTISVFLLALAVSAFLSVAENTPGKKVAEIPAIEVRAADNTEPMEAEVLAPNGKMTVKLIAKNMQEFTHWSIYNAEKQIYSAELPFGETVSLPYNSFSPDNKHLLIKEISGDIVNYKIIKTDGGAFRDGANELNIGSLFAEKYNDLEITEATGWADMSLVLINTDYLNGKAGPSLWFNVSNKSFTRLSTRFD